MIGALGKILDEVQFGPYKRKVKKYLDEARADSVLEDLKKALAPRLRGVKSLWTTFDTYCVEDSSQQPYWNDNSFRKYLEKLYPDVAMSEASIQLLWRCFYFYAYHPFPRDTTDGKLDSAAFQRAVALLVVQGTDILGTQDGGDYFWRNDDAYFRKANFESIFRSIGLPENTDRPSNHLDYDSTSILEAAMDVLAMTQPHTVSLAPSPDQLRPAAQKLLGEGASQRRYRIGREDLSALLSLLLRLRLREAKWGSRFHFGTIGKRDPGNEELADILVRGLGENQDEEYLTSGQIIMSMDLLPNLQLQFHQLWAVLFQPPMTADDKAPSQIPGAIPNHILAAISLFIPQPKISSHSQPTTQDMRISLEDSFPPSQRSYDPTVTRLVQSLVQDPHPHLILLTSNATATTPLTVIGAYFPRPLSNAKGEKHDPKTSTPHLLFQLRPNFRLLRWNGPHMLLTQIINTEDDAPLLRAVAASDEPPLESTKAYRIGDPERKGAGLCIDPETKSATLTSNITDTDSGKVVGYKPVYMTGNDNDITAYSNWEVAVKIDHFEIFRVKVGIDAHGASEGAKDQNRYAQDATQEKIQGLYAMIVMYKTGGSEQPENGIERVDLGATAIAKYGRDAQPDATVAEPGSSEKPRMLEDVKEKMKQLRLASGETHGEAQMPVPCARLIFPALDAAGLASPAAEEERNSDGIGSSIMAKSKSASKFLNDYYDRRAQASYAYQNPESTLTAQAAPAAPRFRSRFADPNHATNTHFFTLITGGKFKAEPLGRRRYERAQRQAAEKLAQGIREQSSKRLLQENVHYLMVVNKPTEEELLKAKRDIQEAKEKKAASKKHQS